MYSLVDRKEDEKSIKLRSYRIERNRPGDGKGEKDISFQFTFTTERDYIFRALIFLRKLHVFPSEKLIYLGDYFNFEKLTF